MITNAKMIMGKRLVADARIITDTTYSYLSFISFSN